MPEETTDAPSYPSTAPDGTHIPSDDVPDDPAAAASAEIFAAMNGSTLAEAEAAEGGDDEAAEGETPAAE
jgi:hypothetical protein